MLTAARFYRRSLGAHFRAVLEYQSDFWLLIGAGVLTQSLGLVFLGAVLSRVPQLNGWRFEELVLIYGMAGLSQAAVPLLADGIWTLGKHIHNGELDYRLVRPYPAILQMMSNQVGFAGIGDAVGASAMLIWALLHVHMHWTVAHVLIGPVIILSAIATRISITVASNAVSFWVRSPMPTFASALFQVGELARYPISIYGMTLRLIIGAVVPFAFAGFFPAAWLLGKNEYAWLGLCTPLVAAAVAFAGYAIFQRGVRRYESSGH